MEYLTFLNDYMVPVIMGLCLCVGFIIKHWIKDADNKIIPTACAIFGAGLAIWMNWPNVTPEVILAGVWSGLASTGLHQLVTQFIGKNKAEICTATLIEEGVDAEELDADQLRQIALQMNLSPTDDMSRADLLRLIETAITDVP